MSAVPASFGTVSDLKEERSELGFPFLLSLPYTQLPKHHARPPSFHSTIPFSMVCFMVVDHSVQTFLGCETDAVSIAPF